MKALVAARCYYLAQNCPHCRVVQLGLIRQDRRWTPYRISFRGRAMLPAAI
jgi:phage FluMu protein Com